MPEPVCVVLGDLEGGGRRLGQTKVGVASEEVRDPLEARKACQYRVLGMQW
jgi:hypothetical protein